MARVITLSKGRLVLREDKVLGFIERRVTKFGNGAKVDCPKEHLGRRAYLIIVK